MQFVCFTLTLAAIAEVASAAQLLICSDSTTANYALNDTLQGYCDSRSLRGIPRDRRDRMLTRTQMGLLPRQLHYLGRKQPC